jgi:carbon-monoxide dehydrogenase medium subunit
MLLHDFEFHEPATEAEACEIMGRFGASARPIAGGTDLMVNMKKKIVMPEQVVSLGRIDALRSMERDGDALRIGACVTVSELAESDLVHDAVDALAEGARALGSPLVRNLATIGGNLGSARPAADLPPPLLAYGAGVVIAGNRGRREMDLGAFFKGPGMTALDADEIITEIRVPVPVSGAGAGYLNIGVRKAQDCNIVNVASFLELDVDDGRIRTARIVMGSVGPTPLRAPSAEKLLIGEMPGDAVFERASRAASRDSSPILDFRGSAEYRRAMVGVLTRRTLAVALKKATTNR